jgi:TPP-dependent pyruvate/acetoin dehydrogenase alpha subunit
MDVFAVERATRRAAAAVRAGEGPQFIEFRTYRFRAHSMYDPELYRTKEEVEEWKKNDPISNCRTLLDRLGLLDASVSSEIEARVGREVAAAVAEAEAGSWEPLADLTRDVCAPPGR